MLSPATFGRPYLNERVRARGGVVLRILERPGRWMSSADLASVVADLRKVVAAAVPAGALDYGVVTGDADRLDSAILTIAYAADGVPIAFNAMTLLDCELRGQPVEVLHLGLVVIDPTRRASGLSGVLYGLTAFLLFARRRLRPLWISNVTQVPAVFGMVAESFDRVYPTSSASDRQRYDHLHLARQIMERHRQVFGVGPDAEFDEQSAIIRNAYTGGSDNLKKTYAEAPRHRNEAHNEFCAKSLDYDRGDDFLQIGQVSLRAARAFFTRSASAISPRALALQFSLRALESIVAPAVQWFDPTRPMNDLRPAA